MNQLELMLRMMDLLENCINELDSGTRSHIASDVWQLRSDIEDALKQAQNDELI